jgi:ABC-type antimicrobial peptide transport system permease subunit
MPLLYAVKHVFRSWKLFLALLIGIMLASTFYAGIDIKANVTAKQALDQQLSNIYVDMEFSAYDLNSTQVSAVREAVMDVEGVTDVEMIYRLHWWSITVSNENGTFDYSTMAAGIASNSHVYEGWMNKPSEGVGENETYVLEGSPLANKVKIGDTIQINFSSYSPYGNVSVVPLNLKVKGFAQLDEKAYSIASGSGRLTVPFGPSVEVNAQSDLILLSLEKTLQNLLDSDFLKENQQFLIYLNRDALIKAWDVQTSINNIDTARVNVQYRLDNILHGSATVSDNLKWSLQAFMFTSIMMKFAFTIVSLPIFFIAWYMGTTVSDVSFNLRRREIGLLLTKGFSRGQILSIFLVETVLIGFAGGALGVLLGYLLIPFFTQFSTELLFNISLIDPYTLTFTVIFGVVIALLSTYSSARRASKLATVDALREYLPMEAEKPYKKRWPWLAFILGTYKIIVFMSGINMATELTKRVFASGNFIFMALIVIFIVVDGILTYIGPVLFFWGFTKLFIQSSLKFQEYTTRAAKFLGDLGTLATKNIRRNPARSAAIAFLIALIVSYSIQVSGQLASEYDFNVRRIYNDVGADVTVYVSSANEAENVSSKIMANLSTSIENSTIEYSFEIVSGSFGYLPMKAVQPQSWLEVAYYESEWFTGTDAKIALDSLATDNNTIILGRSFTLLVRLNIGDYVSLNFGNGSRRLKIVGFFGPEQSQQNPFSTSSSTSYSFIPEGLYKEIQTPERASSRIMIKLKGGANGKTVAESIRGLGLEINFVQSFAEQWESMQSNVLQVGMLDVQRLGIFFAVLAASVGTALISVVSMKERSREATIMSVRGLSYKQLIVMFLTENLAVVTFAVLLGLFVGFITLYGNISAGNANIFGSITMHRLVFPLDSALTLIFTLSLIFISTILPILLLSRRYVTKLERMVRLR